MKINSNTTLFLAFTVLLLVPLAALHAANVSGETNSVRKTIFDIRDFGAAGDATTMNTAAIQKAIDACTANGGGQVLVAGGRFVTGTLYLKDHVTLHIASGSALLGSTNIADYTIDTHKTVSKYASIRGMPVHGYGGYQGRLKPPPVLIVTLYVDVARI